jgi:hypothetical protein
MYDFKHLTLEQRMDIQLGLKEGLALKDLSERIRKSPRTISQEIRLHLIRKESSKSEFNGTPKFACSQHLRYPFVCDACPFKPQCASDRYTYDAKTADKAYRMTFSTIRRGRSNPSTASCVTSSQRASLSTPSLRSKWRRPSATSTAIASVQTSSRQPMN